MTTLHVTPAEGPPFEHALGTEQLVIGRSSKCDLSIPDRFLSRRHARLYRDDGGWLVEDLGSRNGTFINGRRIERPQPVRPGDVLTISASRVEMVADRGEDDSASTDAALRPAAEVLEKTTTPPPAEDSDGSIALRRYADRLAIINEVHHALAGPITLDDLLDLILDRVFEHLRPEHGAIFLSKEKGGYERAAGRSLPNAAGELVCSERLIQEVAGRGMAALVLDAKTDARFADAASMLDAGVRSLIAAPLLDPKGAVGFMALCSNAAVREFTNDDLELLVTLASVAAMRIRNVALSEGAAERQRLEWELKQARRIQVGLFPHQLPQLAGYELYAGNIPSREVSGDYYEVLERAGGSECVVMVADVAGKGLSASLLTGYLEAMVSVAIESGLDPHQVFNRISGPLYRRTPPDRFATVVMAALELQTGKLRWANAGHDPALLIRSSGSRDWLEPTGLPLGLIEGAEYQTVETTLGPGDLLVLYSDGYTEALSPASEEFGSCRLAESCAARQGEPLETIARGLEREVDAFCGVIPAADDRTLVMVRRKGEGEG
jgi:serine phosphatase RsbU (regulator of sigma subunit)